MLFMCLYLRLNFYSSLETIPSKIGYFCFFWSATIYFIETLKASNRFCAIIIYWKYTNIYSLKNTVIFIGLIFTVSSLSVLPFIDDECQPRYYIENFYWANKISKCNIVYWIHRNLFTIFLPISIFLNSISSMFVYLKRKNLTR